jgi:short subunit dehydrogenase-like uncharacterized protein
MSRRVILRSINNMVSPPTAYVAAAPATGNRPHDIAIFGCTGNAGRAVAYQAIKSAASKNTRIVLSGRNRGKVEKVLQGIRDELQSEGINSDDQKVDIIIADSSDEKSMLELAKSTQVLVSCAGPYGRYGEAAVKACVEGGSHYVDVTGEVQWVERMITDYGKSAEEAKVALCPLSGYDCVPAELGMWLVGKALENEDENAKLGELALNFRGVGGGFPRGTIETVIDSIEGKNPARRKGDVRFYPKEYRTTAKSALPLSGWLLPKYQMGQFTGPNFMSSVNVPILCRAAPTFGFGSSDLTISDRSVVSGPPSLMNGYGLFATQMYIATLVVGGIALVIPPVQKYLRNWLKTYTYNGNPAGKVYVDAKGKSVNGKITANSKCLFPGDAGIYATGLFATGVANSLLEATSVESRFPRPLAGFHTPVAALDGCREGLLVEKLRDMGAKIQLDVMTEGAGVARELDAAKLRSKL